MHKKIVTGIDVGSANIRVVVVEGVPGEQARLLAATSTPSRGIRRGYIESYDDVVASVRTALTEASRKADTAIKSAYLAVGGITLASIVNDASIAVAKADGEVTALDVERVVALSESSLKINPNSRIVHTIPLYFKLDGKKVLGKPIGMLGGTLEVRTLFITCLGQHFERLVQAVEAAGARVDDVAASPIAASFVSLNKLQRTAGSVLLNFGAESVTSVVFEENQPISLQSYAIGSADITNDVALGLKLSIEEAEDLKIHREQSVTARKKLDEIISARLTDVFEVIEAMLKKLGRNGLLPAGLVLMGGGARLEMLEPLAKAALRLPVRHAVITPPQVAGDESRGQKEEGTGGAAARVPKDPVWGVAYGLCILGLSGDASGETTYEGLIKDTGRSIVTWLKQFLP